MQADYMLLSMSLLEILKSENKLPIDDGRNIMATVKTHSFAAY